MIRVYTAADPADAQLVCDLLNDRGLKAVVQGEALWAARGDIPAGPTTAPSLIAEYETRPKEHPPPWKCPKCGEKVEGQFSECWKCGAKRPPA